MDLYLIRHGETDIGKVKYISMGSGILNKIGIEQARTLSLKFKKTGIDLILTSPYKRSKETAKIISNAIKKKMIIVSALKEKKFPSEVEGKYKTDLNIKHILKLLEKNETDPRWHYSDEENLTDVINRAKKLLKYLRKFKKTGIAIVSHKFFLATLLFILDRKVLDLSKFRIFYKRNHIKKGKLRKRSFIFAESDKLQ